MTTKEPNATPNLEPRRQVTRVPSLTWLVCLVLLGATALLGQGWGLQTLMDFATRQAEWTATERQRGSLVAAWGEEQRKQKSAAQQATQDAEKARIDLATAQAERDAAAVKLAGVLRDLALQRQARDEAVAAKIVAETEATSLRQASRRLQADIAELQDSKRGFEVQIATLKQDAAEQADAIARLMARLAALDAKRQATEKARDDATESLTDEQRRLRQVFTDAQAAEKRRHDALRSLGDAEAKLATLQTQLDQKTATDADLDRLRALVTELRKTQTSLHDEVTILDETVAAQTRKLATVTGEWAAIDERRRAAEGELVTVQAKLATLKGETEASLAGRDKAIQDLAGVQKTVEGLHQQQVDLVSVVRSLAAAATSSLKATTQSDSSDTSDKE